jgi:adenylate cyclase
VAIEIERKFLVVDNSWRPSCVRSEHLKDGMVAISDGNKIRVRISCNDKATLTMKTTGAGLVKAEYEYPIPIRDAADMLSNHCGDRVLEKVRHHLTHMGLQWVVDVYCGILSGIVIAEVELMRIDQEVPLPPWIGIEVTGRPEYGQIQMLRSALQDQRSHTAFALA